MFCKAFARCDCVGAFGCGVCNLRTTITGCADPAASNYSADNIFADNGQCLYNTTFNVDMSCFAGSTEFYEVFVTGPLWGWPANSGFNQLLG